MKKILIIICIIVAFVLGLMIFGYIAEPASTATTASIGKPPTVSALQAILIDGKTGEVLYEKNADQKGYPASTTKIMTALVALDICKEMGISPKQKLVVPKEAVGVEGSSLYLKGGEKKTIEDLLYGVMLRSGNDGATALAATMGGNLDNFVKRMNEKARELDCKCTNFVNPSGLFDDNHYTTARDLATIAQCAMKDKTFRKVVGAKSWEQYTNKNKTVFQYEGATGIKIGFTKKSGRTLVASAKRKNVELICVVLSDGNWFNDAYALMDYGFQVKGCNDEKE